MLAFALILTGGFAVIGYFMAGRCATNDERMDGVWKGALLAIVIVGALAGARGCAGNYGDEPDVIRRP